jgi:hypothetical protein
MNSPPAQAQPVIAPEAAQEDTTARVAVAWGPTSVVRVASQGSLAGEKPTTRDPSPPPTPMRAREAAEMLAFVWAAAWGEAPRGVTGLAQVVMVYGAIVSHLGATDLRRRRRRSDYGQMFAVDLGVAMGLTIDLTHNFSSPSSSEAEAEAEGEGEREAEEAGRPRPPGHRKGPEVRSMEGVEDEGRLLASESESPAHKCPPRRSASRQRSDDSPPARKPPSPLELQREPPSPAVVAEARTPVPPLRSPRPPMALGLSVATMDLPRSPRPPMVAGLSVATTELSRSPVRPPMAQGLSVATAEVAFAAKSPRGLGLGLGLSLTTSDLPQTPKTPRQFLDAAAGMAALSPRGRATVGMTPRALFSPRGQRVQIRTRPVQVRFRGGAGSPKEDLLPAALRSLASPRGKQSLSRAGSRVKKVLPLVALKRLREKLALAPLLEATSKPRPPTPPGRVALAWSTEAALEAELAETLTGVQRQWEELHDRIVALQQEAAREGISVYGPNKGWDRRNRRGSAKGRELEKQILELLVRLGSQLDVGGLCMNPVLVDPLS